MHMKTCNLSLIYGYFPHTKKYPSLAYFTILSPNQIDQSKNVCVIQAFGF
jgi:hypothetical protein